jgi:hypothetical protein
MAEFVGENAGELFVVDARQQPRCHADGGVFGVASGGESVRLGVLHDINLGHRQTGLAGKLTHEMDELRCACLVLFDGAVHRQHHAVGIPVGEEVGAGRKEEGDQHAGRATHEVADDQE